MNKEEAKKIVTKVCYECPTNNSKECEKSFDCWIRNAILVVESE